MQALNHAQPLTNVASSGRLTAIDTAKGMAIALVVLGHMVARDLKPKGNDWWFVFHDHLYSFHMAFFFFLSGYVFFLQPSAKWPDRLKKTAAKLIPAYVLFAVIVYVAKLLATRFLHVDRPVQHPLDELLFMILYPTESFVQYLWFIVTLLMIYAVMAVFRTWITRHLSWALAIAFAMHLLSVNDLVTKVFALHQLTRYTLFFLAAALCHRLPALWEDATTRFGVIFVVLFAAALVFLPEGWLPTVAGLLSLPAIMAIANVVDRSPLWREPFHFLGQNTLSIYLMNSLAMGLVRGVALKVWDWNDWHFFVVAPLLLTAGLLLPIITQRLLFARWKWTNHITK